MTPSPAADPVAGFVPLEIDGQSYQLLYDFRAIAEAEAKLNAGRPSADRTNLLLGVVGSIDAASLLGLFWAALLKAQPAISMEQAAVLIRPDTAEPIYAAVRDAHDRATKRPTQAAPASQAAAAGDD